LREVTQDPFNCLGDYSDDTDCAELRFAKSGSEMIGAMRTPSLRNVGGTQPYGHKGQQPELSDVLEQYNLAPEAMIGHNEAKPLDLWPWQLSDLEDFLLSLDAPIAADRQWLHPPENNALVTNGT
jgi:cytochrome c peroxidase